MILFLCYSNLQAQNILAKKQNAVKIEISDEVANLSIVNNQFYLHSASTTSLYNQDGKLIKKVSRDGKKGDYFDNEMKYWISSDGRVFNSSNGNELFNISDKLLKKNKIVKFLSKSDKDFFSCIVDPNNLSYSNGIFKISGDDCPLFTYLVGIPAGLYVEDNNLWYLYHKSTPNSNGMLRKYDIKTGELLIELEIPVIEPVGLNIQSDLCYVYSNYSHELVTLNLGGK
jgi:hypothetical protein